MCKNFYSTITVAIQVDSRVTEKEKSCLLWRLLTSAGWQLTVIYISVHQLALILLQRAVIL